MTLEEYKKSNCKSSKIKPKFLIKLVFSLFILFSILSICKLSPSTKKLIKEELFQTNLNFSAVNTFISKIFSFEKTSSVSEEGLKYKNYSPYLNGVKINMSDGESINLIDSGIVVYIGEKEGYGNTIIVQQSNGVDVWYGNVENINVNLYDYIIKNTVIASSKDSLFLVFQKNGEFLDYKDYI